MSGSEETTSGVEAETDPEATILYDIMVDGVFGAVAGFAGTVVLTAFLLMSSVFGGFQFENFSATADILLLTPFVGDLGAAVGYVIFIIGGSIVWPLMLASIGTYLPGDEFSTKGAVFGLVVWPGFALGFGEALSSATTVGFGAFLALSLVGHTAYGYIMGDVFDRLYSSGRPIITRGPTPVEVAEGSETTSDRRVEAAATGPATPEPTAVETADHDRGYEFTPDTEVDGLPPLLRFDQAISRIDDQVGDEEYPQFEAFKREYEHLKHSPANRQTLISDLRADLNPIAERLPDENGKIERWIDSMENRMDTYLGSARKPSTTLDLASVTLAPANDENAERQSVEALRESIATATATVLNQGDRSGAIVRVSFYNEDDILLRSDDLSMGYVDPGERKTLSTNVYVPSIADRYESTVLDPSEDQRFIKGL
jgi:hypothetical protein